ncbi:MAG: hypothetical protein U0264_08680 [Candidatus Kapaibacterium sp.]
MRTLSMICSALLIGCSTLMAHTTVRPTATAPLSDSTPKRLPSSAGLVEATYHTGMSAGLLFGCSFHAGADFGTGLRLGCTMNRLYFGGSFLYHWGSEWTENTSTSLTISNRSGYSVTGELGYDIMLGKAAIVRPYVAIGVTAFVENTENKKEILDTTDILFSVYSDRQSTHYLLVSPGLQVQFPVTRDVFIGGDVRYSILSNRNNWSGFGLYTTCMFRF